MIYGITQNTCLPESTDLNAYEGNLNGSSHAEPVRLLNSPVTSETLLKTAFVSGEHFSVISQQAANTNTYVAFRGQTIDRKGHIQILRKNTATIKVVLENLKIDKRIILKCAFNK
jgi:hypothetical protein